MKIYFTYARKYGFDLKEKKFLKNVTAAVTTFDRFNEF